MACKNKNMKNHRHTNSLITETSPYLLQHAHNPVNWYAWNDETLALAKEENKLLLISIGYFEVAVSGKDALKRVKEINKKYIPNKLICGSSMDSALPLLENRYIENKTLIYVCVHKTCQLPTEKLKQLLNK